MSMEVKDTSRSKSAAEWHNIGKLYRVYMRQQRVVWFFCLMAGMMMIGSIFKIFLITVDTTTANDGIYVHGMSSGFTVAATFYIFVLCGTAVNILTNPVMSLYPGTVKTRFTARILYDCSVMFLITVIAILFHMGTMGVLRLLACTGKYVYSEILFDGKTFFMRAVLWLAYLYMLYFAFILFHTIGTKIGDRTLVIVCFLVFCGGILAWKLGYLGVFGRIYRFYMGANLGFGTALCRVLVTLLILICLSYMVMSMVHSWHENSKVQLVIAIMLCYSAAMGTFVMSADVSFDTSDSVSVTQIEESTLEEDRTAGKVIVNDRIIKPGKVEAQKLNDSFESGAQSGYQDFFGMGFSVGWCEYEQAKASGLISASQSLAPGEMLVRVVANNDYYGVQGDGVGDSNDTHIPVFDRFITDLGVDIVDSKYVVTLPKRVLLYDDFLSSMDRILGSQAVTAPSVLTEYGTDTLRYCQVYIIYHTEDMDSPALIQNYDMVDTPHTWYLPEDWDMSDDEEEDWMEE